MLILLYTYFFGFPEMYLVFLCASDPFGEGWDVCGILAPPRECPGGGPPSARSWFASAVETGQDQVGPTVRRAVRLYLLLCLKKNESRS